MANSPTAKQIIAQLRSGEPHTLVIVAIPSHDRRNKPIHNQELWADAALKVFSKLYGGATAFKTFKGIYRSESGEDLYDEPIMIESYVERSRVEEVGRLELLLKFLHRMRREANQEVVLLVFDNHLCLVKNERTTH